MSTGDGNETSLIQVLTGLQDPKSIAGFLEIALDAVITFNPQERITSWNPAAEKLFGWTLQEALGKTPSELFWPVDTPHEQEDKRQRLLKLANGETFQGEFTPCRKDGSYVRVQFTARASFDPDGKLNGYLAIYHDISAQVQAREKEVELERSNQKLNQILTSIQDDFYVLDRNWLFVFTSSSFTSKIGKEPKDFVGNNIWEMFPKHRGSIFEKNFRATMENREIQRFEIPGQYTNAWYRMTTFPSAEGITVIGTDITERKRAEQALRESEERYRHLVKNAPTAIYEIDIETTRFTEVNDSMSHILGYTREELLSINPEELLEEESRERFRERILQTTSSGKIPEQIEYRVKKKDGQEIWAVLNTTVNYANGRPKTVSVIAHDITERKQAEIALRESERQLQLLNESLEQKVQEKTAEIRRLAADTTKAVQRERHRISHILHDDLQQRIYAIQMQLTFLHNELEKENEAARRELSEIEENLGDVLEITRHLSIDLSPPILREEGLSQAISWLAGQMLQRYGLPIEVQADEIFAIPDEELHVFLFNCVRELLFNVVKHAEASQAIVALRWTDSGIQIEVSDNGKGFPVESLESQLSGKLDVEDSLQQTFGLPTIMQQLSLFGGRMEIQSEPGIGTRAILIAPVDRGR